MPVNVSKALREKLSPSGVASTVREYEQRLRNVRRGESGKKRTEYQNVSDLYCDLVTDFYEYGWGRSFHFAPRVPGESFRASLTTSAT